MFKYKQVIDLKIHLSLFFKLVIIMRILIITTLLKKISELLTGHKRYVK